MRWPIQVEGPPLVIGHGGLVAHLGYAGPYMGLMECAGHRRLRALACLVSHAPTHEAMDVCLRTPHEPLSSWHSDRNTCRLGRGALSLCLSPWLWNRHSRVAALSFVSELFVDDCPHAFGQWVAGPVRL